MNKNNRISEFSLILITQDNHTFLVVYLKEIGQDFGATTNVSIY